MIEMSERGAAAWGETAVHVWRMAGGEHQAASGKFARPIHQVRLYIPANLQVCKFANLFWRNKMNLKRKQFIIIFSMIVLATAVLLTKKPARADTIIVSVLNDSGAGSLRAAIEQANANAGPDTIQFNLDVASQCGGGICTIQPATSLPALTDDDTTIDGYSQPGASPATADSAAVILIEIDGSTLPARLSESSPRSPQAGGSDILAINSSNNIIQGLAINRASRYGISLWGSATNNTISGNYIGLSPDGSTDLGNVLAGIFINGGADHNLIGGNTPAARNVISGNEYGIRIIDAGTTFNTVSGNYIGVNAGSTAVVGNTTGILVSNGAQSNVIGGDTADERNIISGNGNIGIAISGHNTMSNTVSGNYIGTDTTGMAALPNRGGIRLEVQASYNIIGGKTAGERNLISGNTRDGIEINNTNTISNTVSGNYIGTTAEGTAALSNGFAGIYIRGASQYNHIGPDNVISGNIWFGVEIQGNDTMSNTVSSNIIGLTANGATALGNQRSGVFIHNGAQYNVIGGESDAERNIISSNALSGVHIADNTTQHNDILGNYIGTDITGTAARGNGRHGVVIKGGAHHNHIAEGNVISANEWGIWIEGANNSIVDNRIGTTADGGTPLGNANGGIYFSVNAQANTAVVNDIRHNGGNGVGVDTPTAYGNMIVLNSIYANDARGIRLTNGAQNGISAPTIHAFTPATMMVEGTACPGCRVDIYASRDGDGEGETFAAVGIADPAGDYDIVVDSLPYPYLTATATDIDDGTSEFSAVFTASIPVLNTSTKRADRAAAAPEETVTYTLTLTNTGTVAAMATLTDTLPSEVTWSNAYSASAGVLTWDDANHRLLWNGSIPLGVPVTIVYQVTVNADVAVGTVVTNTAVLSDNIFEAIHLGPTSVTVVEEEGRFIYLPVILNG